MTRLVERVANALGWYRWYFVSQGYDHLVLAHTGVEGERCAWLRVKP